MNFGGEFQIDTFKIRSQADFTFHSCAATTDQGDSLKFGNDVFISPL
jgi:hypothetical protein